MTVGYKTYTCPVGRECGGCEWLSVPYEIQLRRKHEGLVALYEPFGVSVDPVIGMDEPICYRAKIQSPFVRGRRGRPHFGMYERRSHNLIEARECLVEYPEGRRILETIANLAWDYHIAPYNEFTGRGLLRHAVIRVGHATGEVMVTLVVNRKEFPHKKAFVADLRDEHPEIATVVFNVNTRRTNAVLGPLSMTAYGQGWIEDEVCGCTFRIPSSAFYQTNPVQTEVHTFSTELIAEAVNFEMSRNGQVFIVNNRISSLYDLEALLHKHVPDARVCVGHGQMPPEELENIIFGFVHYDYDVLVSTTIIESGIDIPNANTIIINGAQNFGLSDLHQMRGRVGRSNKKAFCYLLAPPLAALTRRRLQAIENFSDLGSGIHIAMQDLDIRGAGNLLGAEQSGFIADLGYETYQKILSEAVKELKNDEFGDLYAEEIRKGNDLGGENFVDECALESDLQMSFPDDYVPSSSERMLLYRELDGLERDEDVEAFRLRMKDRFGEIPEEGEELIRVVTLRRLGKCLGAEKIFLKAGRMVLYFVQNEKSAYFESKAFGQCIAYAAMNAHRSNLREANGRRSMVIQEVRSVKDAVGILRQISELQAV